MAIAKVARALLKKKAAKKAAKKRPGGTRLKASLRRAPVRWRIPPSRRRAYEQIFEDQFGPKPSGVPSWSTLAERYPERFRDYVADAEGDDE
jgi:hypothetical protein